MYEILQAAHWPPENIFTSFYLKDVVWNDNILASVAVLDRLAWTYVLNVSSSVLCTAFCSFRCL